MRVLHVLDTFERGGAQRVASDLCHWLSVDDVEVAAVGFAGPFADRFPRESLIVQHRRRGFLGQLWCLARVVYAFRPDVLHAHQRREALYCAVISLVTGIPYVEHAHTVLPSTRFRWLSFKGRVVFAVSEDVASMVVRRFRSTARVLLAPNVVDVARGAIPGAEESSRDQFRVLSIGRLTTQKDPERFVRICHELGKKRDVWGVWAGEGELLERARGLAQRLDSPVEFVGPIEDSMEFLTKADVLLSTSRWEGMPLVMLEAMAARCPVAAPNIDGVRELLDEGRGELFGKEESDPDVASRIAGWLDSGAARRGAETAYNFVLAERSPERLRNVVATGYEIALST